MPESERAGTLAEAGQGSRGAGDDQQPIAFMARVTLLCTLPHRATPRSEFKRRNGNVTLAIHNRSAIGIPYGRYPRLLICWVTTEAVRRRTRHLELGHSLNRFMAQLGLRSQSGGRRGIRTGLRDQMRRLFTSTLSVTIAGSGDWHDVGFRVANETHLWWDAASIDGLEWGATVALSPAFFDAIIDRPVPVDLRTLRALRSPFAIDLYCWLTYRVSYLKRPVVIPWDLLAEQFGHGYGRRCDFRKRLIKHLGVVLGHYAVVVRPLPSGLMLRPGSPHVSRRCLG